MFFNNLVQFAADNNKWQGSRDGAVVRALASHQCGLGSNLGPGNIQYHVG